MAAHEDVEEDQATDDPGDADGHVGGSHEPGQVHASIFNQTWLNSQHPHQRRSSKASVEIKLRQMVLAQEVRDRAEPSRSPETPTSARSGQRPSSPRLLRPGTGRPSAVSPHMADDDGDKLLPGEASSARSGDVDDARRWFETYDELCRLKHKILTDLESQKVRVPPEGDAEVKDDEAMLRTEYERLLGRREFWHSEFEARQHR